MKIESGRNVSPSSGARRAGGAAAPGFAPATDGAAKTASAAPVSAAHSIDAILALQAVDSDGQRRARQARRGKDALDTLEKVERALLLGGSPASLRAELEAAQRGAETTGEAGLDDVLREIDIRVAVELAKLEMNGRAR